MAILPHISTRTVLITTGVVTAVGAVVYLIPFFRKVVSVVERLIKIWRMVKKITSVTGSVFNFPFKLLRAEDDGGAADGALVLRDVDAATEPRAAMQAALDAIRDGHITTLGGLIYFLRGPPSAPFATATTAPTTATTTAAAPVKGTTSNGAAAATTTVAAAAAADQHKVRNEHRLGVSLVFVQFVQESYLPATSNNGSSSNGNNNGSNKSGDCASCARVERAMFEQLVHASHTLRRLDAERATAFDDGNVTHVNLLQQLWAATGRPASSYQRTSPLWQQLGFQGNDPASDLRGGGVFALRQFVAFAQTHTAAFRDAMAYNKRVQDAGTDAWFMLAVVSIQLSTQLLLQREFALARPHLEVVYDMVHEAADDNNGSGSSSSNGSSSGGGNKTAVLSRAALAYRVYHTTLTACSDARLAATAAAATTTTPQPRRSSGGSKDGDKAGADVRNGGNNSSNNKKKSSKEGGNDDDDAAATAALAQLWTRHMCDVEVGLNMLHHALLLYFIQSWERDKPRVADYNTYIVEHVFATFFTPTWSLSTDTTPTTTTTTGTSGV